MDTGCWTADLETRIQDRIASTTSTGKDSNKRIAFTQKDEKESILLAVAMPSPSRLGKEANPKRNENENTAFTHC